MTEEEREITHKVMAWMNGIPDEAPFPEDPIFVALIAAKAELYKLALRHGENDVFERQQAMHNMISAQTLIALCWAWQELRQREFEEEHGLEEVF